MLLIELLNIKQDKAMRELEAAFREQPPDYKKRQAAAREVQRVLNLYRMKVRKEFGIKDTA